MYQINCGFYNAINLGEETPDWEFTEMICEVPEYSTSTFPFTEISDGTSTFYLMPTIDLGDVFLMGFLAVFTGLLIFKFIWDFFHPRIIKMKGISDL